MNETVQRRHRNKLTGQMNIGSRWSVVARLSHGADFLAGKKIPTIMRVKSCHFQARVWAAETSIDHRHNVPWKKLESFFAHITENCELSIFIWPTDLSRIR